ncbi:MAG: TlpA family protein disulfide reductase [endosymbiont of Galathealinum brachiosum]|uniref:TlpA family protein disulfide reductase n=1 Tax=endosymbiont of Galathealinum brachiosum TaxID=2200906 RepID=A0A370DDY0_9GAMM|nr:MAG: TlpA family protein disulfide reductase [endosymbiont of Galathealinum brachiosum]
MTKLNNMSYLQSRFHLKQLVFCLIILISNITLAEEEKTSEETDASGKQLAWNFTLKSQSGKNIKLSELRGRVIALNFWDSRCGTCIQQFPVINTYYQSNKNNEFTLLSVNIDEDLLTATRFIKKRKFDYPVLLDTFNQASRLYSVSDLPTLFLIDKDGYLRHSLDDSQIKQQKITQQVIEGLLNE